MSVSQLIASFGYLAVFLLVGAESLGVPVPGETALVTAAIYAGHTHRLSPWLIFVIASVAAIVGDNIGYWIGDKGGYRLLRAIQRRGVPIWAGRWRRVHPINERDLKVARYLFDRHGAKVVFLGRFVSVLRTYAAFLAGVSQMHWRRFFIANASGGIVWAAIFTFVAYMTGEALERASGTVSVITGIVAAVLIIAGVVLLRRRIEVLAERAEEAYPGPLTDHERPAGRMAQARLSRGRIALRVSRAAPQRRVSRAAGGHDHVGDKTRRQAEQNSPIQIVPALALERDTEQLDDDIEDGTRGERKEYHAHGVAGELAPDGGAKKGRAAADEAHQQQEAPGRPVAVGGQRRDDAESLGGVVQGKADDQDRRESDGAGGGASSDREALAEVVQPDPDRDEQG
jgi:membrane protein DedA with SNARE-associated domain